MNFQLQLKKGPFGQQTHLDLILPAIEGTDHFEVKGLQKLYADQRLLRAGAVSLSQTTQHRSEWWTHIGIQQKCDVWITEPMNQHMGDWLRLEDWCCDSTRFNWGRYTLVGEKKQTLLEKYRGEFVRLS